jgi:hypothetical protein
MPALPLSAFTAYRLTEVELRKASEHLLFNKENIPNIVYRNFAEGIVVVKGKNDISTAFKTRKSSLVDWVENSASDQRCFAPLSFTDKDRMLVTRLYINFVTSVELSNPDDVFNNALYDRVLILPNGVLPFPETTAA